MFRQTTANAVVVGRLAKRINATSTVDVARVLANLVDTSLLKFAVEVVSAAIDAAVVVADLSKRTGSVHLAVIVRNRFAFDIGVSKMILVAFATRPVLERRAF